MQEEGQKRRKRGSGIRRRTLQAHLNRVGVSGCVQLNLQVNSPKKIIINKETLAAILYFFTFHFLLLLVNYGFDCPTGI